MKFGKYFTPSRVFGCACKIWLTWKWVPLTVKYSPFTSKTIYRPILPSKLIFWSLTPEKRERARGKVTNSDHPPRNPVRSRCPIPLHIALMSHAKPKPKHGEIGRRWSLDCRPQPIALLSCMQPWFGSDRLLTISSATTRDRSRHFFLSISLSLPPPLDQPTHDQSPLSLSQFASLFSSIAHSFFLPLLVWPRMTMFDEWFFVLSFVFLSLYIEIFYYKICLKAEKMWKTSRKWAFS